MAMSEQIEGCPQSETPIRERAWADGQRPEPKCSDAERLDWLEEEANTVRAVETNGGQDMHFEVVSYHMAPPTERVIGIGASYREAIDAAMQEQSHD